jgi:hypothetical protein
MRQYFSPFIDKKGSYLTIWDIHFSHIAQLKERNIEEGYQVEYKSRWDDNFIKKHLCQTITSFANSEGGWLFIGIEDGTAEYIGIEKHRTDFNQVISQKLATVSPIPKFESKFVKNSQDKRKGVLVVYIYEGINPPYICNGTIYLRNGSSKVPIKPGRTEIDNLIHKRDGFKKKHKEFCTNNFVDSSVMYPLCSVYLYNPYAEFGLNNLLEKLKFSKQILSEMDCFQRIGYSSESVLCYNSDIIAKNSVTSISEFFADGNIKISIPLFCCDDDLRKAWARLENNKNSKVDISEMLVIDGYISYMTIHMALKNAFEFIKKCGFHINDYYISFEYKSVRNAVLFFRTYDQENESSSGNFYICPKNKILTKTTYFINDVNVEDIATICYQLLDTNYALQFGIDPDELLNRVIASMPLYQEKIFSSKYKI